VLAKPFSPRDVLKQVKNVLDAVSPKTATGLRE